MYFIIIICILACLYFLVALNIINLNRKTAPLMIIFVTILTSLVFRSYLPKDSFKTVKQEDIQEIWMNNHEEYIRPEIVRTVNRMKKQLDVNEPNYVVTDDQRLYSIVNGRVIVNQVDDLKTIKELTYKTIQPMYLALTKTKLIVIGEVDNKTTEVLIYNKEDYQLFKQIKIDAKYVTSQVINDYFYLVTSNQITDPKQTQTYTINQQEKTVEEIYHIKNTYSNNYVNIIKTNLNEPDQLDIMSYLGLGYSIYFSKQNIYIAEEMFNKVDDFNKTILVKIDLDHLELKQTQEIKGFVLDEYSMNEYNNTLRVATSESYDDYFTNHLYILDENMKVVGKLENFSTGNQIQAATFIENKAYIETFNIHDPFYVIDLKNNNPQILSEVQFSGYDTFLLPYDQNYLIAFGFVLNEEKNPKGLKISLYHVSDTVSLVSQDTIMYKDYHDAFTEVMYESKFLLVDHEKQIIGFPVTYWLGEQANQYKSLYFVYQVNFSKGLKQIGTISHDSTRNNQDIKGGLIINNKLYTISDHLIKVNNLKDLIQIKQKVIN